VFCPDNQVRRTTPVLTAIVVLLKQKLLAKLKDILMTTKKKRASYSIIKYDVKLSFQLLSCFQFRLIRLMQDAQIVDHKLLHFLITATSAAWPSTNRFC